MSLTCIPTLSSSIASLTTAQSPLLLKKTFRKRRHSVKLSAVAGSGGELVGDIALLLQLVDPWAPTAANSQLNIGNSQNIASQLFAASLFPYLGFLYHITRSNSAPKLTLFGFYFLLAFVAATIPAGIYVLGLRKAVRNNNHSDGKGMSISENDYSDRKETSISESESVEENVM